MSLCRGTRASRSVRHFASRKHEVSLDLEHTLVPRMRQWATTARPFPHPIRDELSLCLTRCPSPHPNVTPYINLLPRRERNFGNLRRPPSPMEIDSVASARSATSADAIYAIAHRPEPLCTVFGLTEGACQEQEQGLSRIGVGVA